MALWAQLSQSARRPAVILEDDVHIGPAFVRVVAYLVRLVGSHFDMLSLTYYHHLTRSTCVSFPRELPPPPPGAPELVRLRCPRGLNSGTPAYIVSPRGSKRLLDASLPLVDAIDLQLGTHSPELRWLALRHERSHAVVSHIWSMPSLRVHGLREQARWNRTAQTRAAAAKGGWRVRQNAATLHTVP